MKIKYLLIVSCSLFFCKQKVYAQQETIHWLNFEQLEDSMTVKPKKVFISFYADWCIFCKKMDQAAFKNTEVIQLLNNKYYAVKMNAESKDSIRFGNTIFTNKNIGKFRKPTHEIPLLLASRRNTPFSLPAHVILNENMVVEERYFEYLSPKKMIEILEQ